MSTINDFDESIKRQFLKGAPILPEVYADKEECYGREITIRGKKNIYDTYFNEELGEKILQIIDKGIKQRYKDGKGGEFKYKFFSVASSSRFAVASFSNNVSDKIMYINQYSGEEISEILFEKNLPINNISGTSPQMDVWIKTSHDIFFEVKCHEIFEESHHANIKISTQYSTLVYIQLAISPIKNTSNSYIRVTNQTIWPPEQIKTIFVQKDSRSLSYY